MNENVKLDQVIEALESRGLLVKERNGYLMAQCPAHDDSDPSLSISEGDKGVVLRCHAGCANEDVVAALGLTLRDLFYDSEPGDDTRTSAAPPAEYIYQRADGTEFAKVVRRRGKKFHQVRKVGEHWESGGCPELNATPYGLPKLIADVAADRTVLVPEGERDVETAWSLDWAATCNAGGAGCWKPEHSAYLRGADVVIVRDRDKQGRDHAAKVHDSLRGLARSVRVVDPAPGCKDLTDHVSAGHDLTELVEVNTVTTDSSGVLVSLADVEAERLTWLWPNRLPAGKLITLDGDPSLGKSTLAVTFASHISTGTPWPDGAPCEVGTVVMMSAEDGMADTIRPRLDAAGGDPARVHMLTAITVTDDEGETTTRPPTLGDIGAIRGVVERTGARLLVVDVLMAYMPGKVDSHRDQDVRTVLHRLSEIANETGCAVLLLRHLNKSAGGSAMYRGGGSIGIVGAARAGYLVAPDPDNDGAVVLACVKSNLAREPESLSYRLESAPGTDVARVVWLGGSAHTAQTLLSVVLDRDDEQDEVTVAGKWLLAFLDQPAWGGSAPFKEILKAAKTDDISERTLRRAARSVGVTIDRKGGFGTGSRWHTPQENADRGRNGRNGAGSDRASSVSPGQDASSRSGQDRPVVTPFRPRVSAGQGHSGHSGQPHESLDVADTLGRVGDPVPANPRCGRCESRDTTAVRGRGWFCSTHNPIDP